MCTLALFSRIDATIPILVAANRDEFLERPTAAPAMLSDEPWTVGGRDLVAGGTWLGVNQAGTVVALLNRRSVLPRDPYRLSRGLLCLRALQAGDLAAVERLLCGEDGSQYNAFTLLAASAEGSLVATPHRGKIAMRPLDPGIHVFSNLEVDDPDCPRIARSRPQFESIGSHLAAIAAGDLDAVARILAGHSTMSETVSLAEDDGLCVHRGPYGTRSSSIIAVGASGTPVAYWHADGPPCRTSFRRVSLPSVGASSALP